MCCALARHDRVSRNFIPRTTAAQISSAPTIHTRQYWLCAHRDTPRNIRVGWIECHQILQCDRPATIRLTSTQNISHANVVQPALDPHKCLLTLEIFYLKRVHLPPAPSATPKHTERPMVVAGRRRRRRFVLRCGAEEPVRASQPLKLCPGCEYSDGEQRLVSELRERRRKECGRVIQVFLFFYGLL
jgi:hypothetical protein